MDQSATLVVTLPARGPLEPTAAAEVVGPGINILVTADAVYVATQAWDAENATTALHAQIRLGSQDSQSGQVLRGLGWRAGGSGRISP